MSSHCWDVAAIFDDEDVPFDQVTVLFNGDITPSVSDWDTPCVPISPFGEDVVLVLDEDGDWAIDDDPAAVAEGFFVIDADGDLAIDDAILVGTLSARIDPELDPIAYTTDGED